MKNLYRIFFLVIIATVVVIGQETTKPDTTKPETTGPVKAEPVITEPPKKPKKGAQYSTIAFGPVLMLNHGDGGMAYLLSLGQQWTINDVAAIKFRVDAAADFKAKAYVGDGGIGFNFYLPTNEVTPYLGGDFGFGGAIDNSGSTLLHTEGFSLSLNVGIALYRKSGVYLSLEPTWQIVLSEAFPLIYGIKIGINH